MDTTQHQDDELMGLFRQLPLEKPSAGFSDRVMSQVMLEARHVRRRQRIRPVLMYGAVAIFSGIAIFLTLYLVNMYYGIGSFRTVPGDLLNSVGMLFSAIFNTFAHATDNNAILAGVVLLLLLLGDLFIRRNVERKRAVL